MADHASKLHEQAKAKGDLGYSSWLSTDAPANDPNLQPKLLGTAEAPSASGQEQAQAQGVAVPSAWNAAGTFEERGVTDWARQRLEEMLPGTSSGQAVVTRVTSIKGDAHVFFVRGKKRHGFDLAIELAWQAGASLEQAEGPSGTLKLPEVTPDDLDDLPLELSGDAAGHAAAAGLKQALQQRLAEFLAELRAL